MRLIDADELMELIRRYDYELADRYNTIDDGMFTDGIEQAIDEVQTIENPGVDGHWDVDEDGDSFCSVCKCDAPIFFDDWEYKSVHTRYCPNCGAKMNNGDFLFAAKETK